jgi:hypothetical protein
VVDYASSIEYVRRLEQAYGCTPLSMDLLDPMESVIGLVLHEIEIKPNNR